MPMYLDKQVSDDYLNGLKEAYREGYRAGGGDPDESDQPILDRLAETKTVTAPGAHAQGKTDAEHETGAGKAD